MSFPSDAYQVPKIKNRRNPLIGKKIAIRIGTQGRTDVTFDVQMGAHSVYNCFMFHSGQRRFATAVAALATANPFRPDDVARFENQAASANLSHSDEPPIQIPERPRIGPIVSQAAALLKSIASEQRQPSGQADLLLHAKVVRFVLYFQFRERLQRSVEAGFANPEGTSAEWFMEFRDRFNKLSLKDSHGDDPISAPEHVLACFFQIRRAYYLIQSQIIGTSRAINELRAAAWDSVFTIDMEQYGRLLFDRMRDFSTLIVGPSGTGKELVARAIGLSRYIPFNPRSGSFEEPFTGAFHAVNLSALSPTLVESELFGHAKGAFTGASSARKGWLETCQMRHSVFLDEIGELDPTLQVKLLRVLQERAFQRIGEVTPRRFEGKVIAATNRDLHEEMAQGRFRDDLYYRLCSDVIETPSLRVQLNDQPNDIDALVSTLVARQMGCDLPEVVERAINYIRKHLADYSWPGNVRELEQCVRSILVRGRYVPIASSGATPRERLARKLARETPTSEELLNEYCRVIYSEHRNYSEVSRILGLDRRTVQRRVES